MSFFSLGLNTFKVPMSMHAKNRGRLLSKMNAKDVPLNSIILLKGGESQNLYDTDRETLFRQESYFNWLFGVSEPDCYGGLHIGKQKSLLFIPRLPEKYSVWMGKIQPPEHFKQKYEVDEVYFTDQIDEVLGKDIQPEVIYTLKGKNTDSNNYFKEATFTGIEKYRVDNGKLFPEISMCRSIKTPEEIELLRYTNHVSSEAHKEVMKQVKPGMKEYQLESIFLHHAYTHGGCRNVSYTCICCSGENGSILHYGHSGAPNDKTIQNGEMLLLDMGAEYHCYVSDITCCFPSNGKFTQDQRDIYESVLKAHNNVISKMKPGVWWPDMHRLAESTLLEEFVSKGILKGSVDEMMKVFLGYVFMPHGLGHFIGCDTHDVGGYPKNVIRSDEPGLDRLRTGRVLEEGMVITVEPGAYFIETQLKKALANNNQAIFFNLEKLNKLWNFGGVRIESDVVVTATGAEVITRVPRTVDEIEAWMSSQ